jgi:hypothetical protein
VRGGRKGLRGAVARRREARMAVTAVGEVRAARCCILEEQRGHCSTSMAKTLLRSAAHDRRWRRRGASRSVRELATSWTSACEEQGGGGGMTRERELGVGGVDGQAAALFFAQTFWGCLRDSLARQSKDGRPPRPQGGLSCSLLLSPS